MVDYAAWRSFLAGLTREPGFLFGNSNSSAVRDTYRLKLLGRGTMAYYPEDWDRNRLPFMTSMHLMIWPTLVQVLAADAHFLLSHSDHIKAEFYPTVVVLLSHL